MKSRSEGRSRSSQFFEEIRTPLTPSPELKNGEIDLESDIVNFQSNLTPGESDFKQLITKSKCIDKSLFIKKIIEDGNKIKLIIRPRRFGKTLNMSMLKYFFGKTPTSNNHLFEKLKIGKWEKYKNHCGKYPVIFLSFSKFSYDSAEKMENCFKECIIDAYHEHRDLLSSEKLEKKGKEKINKILQGEISSSELGDSIRTLAEYLYKHHDEYVVLIIDEFDAPIQAAYVKNNLSWMDSFKKFLGDTLKDNQYIWKTIMSGLIMMLDEVMTSRVKIEVYDVTSSRYADYFGFSDQTVKNLLGEGSQNLFGEICLWYGGYKIGDKVIFNPTSVSSFFNNSNQFKSYLDGSDETALINKLLSEAISSKKGIEKELATLLSAPPKNSLKKLIFKNASFYNISTNPENIWSFLLFSGFLTVKKEITEFDKVYYELIIPNEEIKDFYKNYLKSKNNQLSNFSESSLDAEQQANEINTDDPNKGLLSKPDLREESRLCGCRSCNMM